MPPPPPAALLVDLDGTLFDTLPDFVAALARVAAELGRPAPPAEVVQRAIGRGGPRLMQDLFGAQAEDALALWPRHYGAVNGQHARPFAGARETLAALQQEGWRLACVTNKPQDLAEALLRDWAPLFAGIVGARPSLRTKPHPDLLLCASTALAVPIGACWMVGDSRNDAEASAAAGCAGTVLFTHGYNHGESVADVPAHAHLDSWSALPAALARLAGSPRAQRPD